jgi:HlyD family type I secretion membrane fusion protein
MVRMSVLPFRKRPADTGLVERKIDAFESETAAVLARENPIYRQSMMWVFAAIFVIVVAMAILIKIDRIATAPGQIVPADGTIVVQPLQTAIIHSLRAHTGDIVKAGQVLATLDPTFAAADLSQLQQKQDSLEAEVARLHAENDGKPYVASSKGPYETLQQAIWTQRQAEYNASLNDFAEREHAAQATLDGLQHDIELLHSRLGLAGDIEKMRTDLEKHDVGSRLNSLLAQDSRLQDQQALQSDEYNMASTKHTLESLRSQREVFIQQWQSTIGTTLVDESNSLDSVRQYLIEAQALRGLSDLKAPQDAIVLDVAQLSVGAVAQAGTPVYTLVPLDAVLEAEVEVSNLDVGFVRPGDPVVLKFDSFPYIRHGVARGVVKSVSEDSFTTDLTGQTVPPFFKARVQLTEVGMLNVPESFRVLPGMTLQGDIVVGTRTLSSYITEGALRTGSEAMREP